MDVDKLLKYVKSYDKELDFNHKLFEIREGNLEKYLILALQEQINARSLKVALQRKAPINVLPKLIDKLSKIYSDGCSRTSSTDEELIALYEKELQLNTLQTENVRNFNTYKNFWIEIYIDEVLRKVKTRPIPSYEIIAYSESNDERVTHVIRCMGDYVKKNGEATKRFWIYTDTEFVAIDSGGNIIEEDMIENGGVNTLGVIPFVYRSKSMYLLVPIPDYDLFSMVLLIAVLYTDLNFASMFSHHGIIYTVDINQENLEISPDIIWNLKSEIDGKTPSVNILRPETNAQNDLMLLKNQISTWLYTRSIKPSGALSDMGSENFSSGLALLISEMDTTEYRKELTTLFKEMEENEFWKKLGAIHNYAYQSGLIDATKRFSEDVQVIIDFPEVKVIEDRATTIANIKAEIDLGILSRKDAMKRLYPKMNEEEIEERLENVSEEKNDNASEEATEVPIGLTGTV